MPGGMLGERFGWFGRAELVSIRKLGDAFGFSEGGFRLWALRLVFEVAL